MEALIIPANPEQPIERKELDGYDGLSNAVGGWIESVPFPDRGDVSVFINEEGKIHGLPMNQRATEMLASVLFAGDFIVGDAVIVGFDPETGDSIDCPKDL